MGLPIMHREERPTPLGVAFAVLALGAVLLLLLWFSAVALGAGPEPSAVAENATETLTADASPHGETADEQTEDCQSALDISDGCDDTPDLPQNHTYYNESG